MSEQLIGRYHGDKKTLFWLVMKTSFLTLITLGIYRFWAKTRIRKYLWSGTAAGQDSFEYTGTGLEKFLGFLAAIVVLAIYLGIVQMILLFFGLSLMADATTTAGQIAQIVSIYISFFAVMPLILFAQYRARRYKMARTRWRGIRFGMDSAAWGFVWRAIAHSFLTIITLGLMVPRQTFYLEKYMADRTWFGDAQFVQNGRWQSLYPGLKHIGLGFLILIGAGVVAATLEAFRVAFFLGVVGYIWLIFGSVYYRIFALNYLTDNKLLNGQIGFYSDAQAGKVVGITIKGTLLIALVGAVIGLVFTGVSAALLTSVDFQNPSDLMGVVGGALGIIGFVAYIGFLLLLSALSFIWITQPIIAHVVDNIVLSGAEHLDAIHQRSADAGADADGFADALDIGGAI
ncbi:MAG: DUF898 family protein [Ascidiaceihabitans sp.]|nr:DUF898 family protein [Ascidiaceihabitans sp.]